MTYPYTKPEFDAFGWSPLSRSLLPPADTYGLDYESARNTTPRWFAVSFGNGNNGVSHTFPDYYVRCAPDSAYHLAACAMLAHFNNAKAEDKGRIIEAMEVDGESDYTISATIYNPEDIEPEDESDIDIEPEDDCGSYCDANGAWLICEVFHVESDAFEPEPVESRSPLSWLGDRPAYASMADAFEPEDLRLTAD